MVFQTMLGIRTRGRTTVEVTGQVRDAVRASGVCAGLCHVFLQHTSASLILCENADPDVRADLETLLGRMAPDSDPAYRHDMEGPDDMAAHARTLLAGHDLTIPVGNGALLLGTWQGVFLWEHRASGHARSLVITITGQ